MGYLGEFGRQLLMERHALAADLLRLLGPASGLQQINQQHPRPTLTILIEGDHGRVLGLKLVVKLQGAATDLLRFLGPPSVLEQTGQTQGTAP